MNRLVTIILTAVLPMVMAGQESYTFTFSQDDFEVTRSGDIITVRSNDIDMLNTNDPHAARLPFATERILNPLNEKLGRYTVNCSKRPVAWNVDMPAAGYPITTDQQPDTVIVREVATESTMSPVQLLTADATQHGYSYSIWKIMPYLYDAEQRCLYFVDEVTIFPQRLLESGGQLTVHSQLPDAPQQPDMPLLPDVPHRVMSGGFNAGLMLNQDALDTYSSVTDISKAVAEEDRIDYLIVTADNLKSYFDELVRWKNMRGVRTRVVSLEEIYAAPCSYSEPQEKIKSYLRNMYLNHGVKFVMLGGDDMIVPVRYCTASAQSIDGLKTGHIPTDLYYACFDGTFTWDANNNKIYGESDDNVDFSPEIHISRLPIRTRKHVTDYVNKLLAYEKCPQPTDYYHKLLLSGCLLQRFLSAYPFKSDAQDFGERLYNACVRKFWDGKVSYLFDTYSSMGKTDLSTEIAKGYHTLEVNAHGKSNRWALVPDTAKLNDFIFDGVEFEISRDYWDSDAVTQTNVVGLILTTSCDTNHFDYDNQEKPPAQDPCLSECLIRNPNGGSLSFIGCARFGWGSTDGNFDGSIAFDGKYLKYLYSGANKNAPYNLASVMTRVKSDFEGVARDRNGLERWLYYGINVMGDAEMPVYTDIPTKIEANVIQHDDYVTVNIINAPNDALITYSDGQIIPNRMMSRSGVKTVEFPTNHEPYTIVISAHNCIPFIYTPTEFDTLVLRNRTISTNTAYKARKIILGENVVVKFRTKLTLTATENLEIRSNVKCEGSGKFEFITSKNN